MSIQVTYRWTSRLSEPSHNARFHALMDKYFPKWREARKETRRLTV